MDGQPEVISEGKCPQWADELIGQLRQVEIFLGNIPKSLAWESSHLDDVAKRVFDQSGQVFDDAKADLIFTRIVRGLHQESFSPEEIVATVNKRIGYRGGPSYCGLDEVHDAIS